MHVWKGDEGGQEQICDKTSTCTSIKVLLANLLTSFFDSVIMVVMVALGSSYCNIRNTLHDNRVRQREGGGHNGCTS